MFRTEHLEGRLLYETDKVVCINVFINRRYSKNEDKFLSQVLISLVNGRFKSHGTGFHLLSDNDFLFTKEDFARELNEGLNQYATIRRELGLSN